MGASASGSAHTPLLAKLTLLLLLAALVVAVAPQRAEAYNLIGCKYTTKNLTFRMAVNVGTGYPTAITEAVYDWSGNTDVNFTGTLNRPGSGGGSQSMEDESHGSTQEVPRRAA